MKKDKEQKKARQPEKERQPEVETPRPPQVIDPSRLPEIEDTNSKKDHPKHGSGQDKKSEKKNKKKNT